MKYEFKQVDDISGVNAVTTVEFRTDSLPDVLGQFEMFLRGCGFVLNGTLDVVPEDEYYGYDLSEHSEQPSFEELQKQWDNFEKHSTHYYDTERNK
jgi:hypothetical protein